MSEEFKAGQIIWRGNKKGAVGGVAGLFLWVDFFDGEQPVTVRASTCTTTEPEPPPQNCPFCGYETAVRGDEPKICVMCDNNECVFEGPWRPTRLEAIKAWNSISILSVPAKTPPIPDPSQKSLTWPPPWLRTKDLEMRIAEEREACAQLADLAAQQCGEGFGGMVLANGIAVAIRKRGQP